MPAETLSTATPAEAQSGSAPNALLGHSGFVGSLLKKQAHFAAQFRSTDIAGVHGREFDTVVCAAAPAKKWIANREPVADREAIDTLIGHIDRLHCRQFILISTVDVFARADGVNEDSPVVEDGLHAYGLHRRLLEKFVEKRFSEHLIVRLPGLVGPGLRKNVIFDFLNDNNLNQIDSRGVFQFYPMVNLWFDIRTALQARLRLLHLTAEPLSVAQCAAEGFGRAFSNELAQAPAIYDFRSRHATLFGGSGHYQYSRRESLQAVRAYAQSEPRTLNTGGAN